MQIQRRWLVVWVVSLLLSGCTPGIHWRLGPYQDAYLNARAQNRLTFAYFRNWYSVECTNFEENVLKQPAVLDATADMICVPLEYNIDRSLAQGWGIEKVPAFAIVDPAGMVYESGSGEITLDGLLAMLEQARQRFAPQTQPAQAP